MKRAISVILMLVLMMSTSVSVFASKPEAPSLKTLTGELLKSNITSEADFEKALKKYAKDNQINKSNVSKVKHKINFGNSNSIQLNDRYQVNYDEANDFMVLVEKVSENNLIKSAKSNDTPSLVTSLATSYTTGSYKATSYSWIGMKIWTVTDEYQFKYVSGVSVSNVYNRGYFNPAILSLWNSTPWMNGPYVSSGKCVVETYGTANLNLGLAQILGLTFNLQSVNYKLKVMCDNKGLTSYTYTAVSP